MLWFLFNAISMAGAGYAEWVAWFQSPLNASLMVMLVLSVFYHAKMGVQVMIEDYVHTEGLKVAGLVGITLLRRRPGDGLHRFHPHAGDWRLVSWHRPIR